MYVGCRWKIDVSRPNCEACNQFDGGSKTFMSSVVCGCNPGHAERTHYLSPLVPRCVSVPSCTIAKFVSRHRSAENFSQAAFWHRTWHMGRRCTFLGCEWNQQRMHGRVKYLTSRMAMGLLPYRQESLSISRLNRSCSPVKSKRGP